MYTKKERQYYNENRDNACQRLGITKNQYNWLRRKGEELRRIYEANCNGEYKTEEEYYKAERSLVYKIQCYVQEFEELIHSYLQTDPRGATIYLSKEPINETNYTKGICIY